MLFTPRRTNNWTIIRPTIAFYTIFVHAFSFKFVSGNIKLRPKHISLII